MPGEEILVAERTEHTLSALDLSDEVLERMSRRRPRATPSRSTARCAGRRTSRRCSATAATPHPQDRGSRPLTWQLKYVGSNPGRRVGSRIQPLAFSKELLPVGSRSDGNLERPRAVSEYIVERMMIGGADKICFVISPWKSDIWNTTAAAVGAREPLLRGPAEIRRACATRSSARSR